jgi:hypothetical protein
MDGKFRVKAEGGKRLRAPPVLRRNRRRINEPPGFCHRKKRSRSRKTLFAWQNRCDYRQ